MADAPLRILPLVTPENEHFWKGGAEGELRMLHCAACAHFVHPPVPICPVCRGRELEVKALSGRGTLATYTINHQPWIPGFDPPYAVAIVELDEQPGLRLTTNLVNCELDALRVGMRVRVLFEEREDEVFIPLFEPDPGDAS